MTEKTENAFEMRTCDQCDYCRTYITTWCFNEQRKKDTYSMFPDQIHCKYWAPHYGRLSRAEKKLMESYGFEKPSFLERILLNLEALLPMSLR